MPRNSPFLMVWCPLSQMEVTKPYFFEKQNVAVEIYESIPLYFAFPRLGEYPGDINFQQYGAPIH